MCKGDKDKVMLAEQVLEVRHNASGTFLDVRGYIADYMRKQKFLPHWRIDHNVVNLRDGSDRMNSQGAFVGYKRSGYVAVNPDTRNFFTDRAIAFWKLLLKNDRYEIPELTRFGTRTKIFVPSRKSFEEINKAMFEGAFTEHWRKLIGGTETDLQFTIELKEGDFDARLIGGPIHGGEADKYFQFESEHFKKCGLYLDIDHYRTHALSVDAIPKLLREAVELTWLKAEAIAASLGL